MISSLALLRPLLIWFEVVVGLVAPVEAGAQAQMVVVRIKDGRSVAIVDIATQTEKQVYSYDPSQGWLHDITAAPSGKYVAVIETERGVVSGIEYARLPRNRLLILDLSGRVAVRIDRDVRRYTWCCEGDKVAFIVGTYHEGGEGFSPEGVYIYDLSSGSETALPLPRGSIAIQWAPFDTSIYVRALTSRDSAKVWRYHVLTQEVSPTRLRDILFSPSGKYYLHYNTLDEASLGWHLVERFSSREVPLPNTSLGAIQGWAFAKGDYLLLARGRRSPPPVAGGQHRVARGTVEIVGYTVYDVSRSTAVQRLDGKVLPDAATSGGGLVVVKVGKLEVISEPVP